MKYYRLTSPWAFRGWKKLPFAIQAQFDENKHKRPYFLIKQFRHFTERRRRDLENSSPSEFRINSMFFEADFQK